MVRKPAGFRLKGSADGVVCVKGAGENRYAVAFDRHVGNLFGVEHVVATVQRFDGHVHRLLVGGKKKVDVRCGSLSLCRAGGQRFAKSGVVVACCRKTVKGCKNTLEVRYN